MKDYDTKAVNWKDEVATDDRGGEREKGLDDDDDVDDDDDDDDDGDGDDNYNNNGTVSSLNNNNPDGEVFCQVLSALGLIEYPLHWFYQFHKPIQF